MIREALAESWPYLALLAGGVVGLALFARDPKADEHDEHDVSDYQPTLAPARRNWPLVDRKPAEPRPVVAPEAPADLTDVPWTPPYAVLVVAQVTRRYGDNPADIAARWLREAGEQARAELAGAR